MKRSATTLRLGFLPVNDCAPLVVAQELGIYKRYGLSVQLHRRTDWKTIHDLIASNQLDAAHAPSVLPS